MSGYEPLELPEGAIVTGKIEIALYLDPTADDSDYAYMVGAVHQGMDGKPLSMLTVHGMMDIAKDMLVRQSRGDD